MNPETTIVVTMTIADLDRLIEALRISGGSKSDWGHYRACYELATRLARAATPDGTSTEGDRRE